MFEFYTLPIIEPFQSHTLSLYYRVTTECCALILFVIHSLLLTVYNKIHDASCPRGIVQPPLPPFQLPSLKIRPAILLCNIQQQARTNVERSGTHLIYLTFSLPP